MGRRAYDTGFQEEGLIVVPHADSAIAYRIPEAARIVGVSRTTMWAWIAEKKIPTRKLGGATVIRRVDLIAFVDAAPSSEQAKAAQAQVATSKPEPC